MKQKINIRWQLAIYDFFILISVEMLLLVFSGDSISGYGVVSQVAIAVVCVFTTRLFGNIYGQIWRYGGIQCYIRLIMTDAVAFVATVMLERILPIEQITFARLMAIASMNLLGALTMRMFYRYAFKCGNDTTSLGRLLLFMLRVFAGSEFTGEHTLNATKINIARVL